MDDTTEKFLCAHLKVFCFVILGILALQVPSSSSVTAVGWVRDYSEQQVKHHKEIVYHNTSSQSPKMYWNHYLTGLVKLFMQWWCYCYWEEIFQINPNFPQDKCCYFAGQSKCCSVPTCSLNTAAHRFGPVVLQVSSWICKCLWCIQVAHEVRRQPMSLSQVTFIQHWDAVYWMNFVDAKNEVWKLWYWG